VYQSFKVSSNARRSITKEDPQNNYKEYAMTLSSQALYITNLFEEGRLVIKSSNYP